jgi:class 3 adenylate cyclase/tetratricopeptide (TPR) repeat protein
MVICARCGVESPDTFRFCPACAAPLGADTPGAREERKVVTVLFADLVGFTSRAEPLDPEDVRALLVPYHARLRKELERFGGTVEKFIGDAAMAVFGAPVAHEDDPERAVRAALAIRAWVTEDPSGLQVRIGVATGETIVNLAARPAEGEGMVAGDIVNTAARLQAAAPVGGILVGGQTHEATKGSIDYGEAVAVAAKGKAEPVTAWPVIQARSRFGTDVIDTALTPFVGRDADLRLLVDTLDRVKVDRSPQLVTLIGVPGMGKSRLVQELFRHVERGPDLITWRQGRCLSYGAGVSFWALREVVKAQAGILETDDADQARVKLHRAVTDLGPDDAEWIEARLSPLVGLAPERELGRDGQAEAFTAWRAFIEALAERRPLVLVLEDLQWADDGLLDFVDHLVEWARDVPLLVVATARPELLARRAGWGGGKANAVTRSLSALGDEDTASLVHALLERSVLPSDARDAVLARAGGNPLYAEEFARLYRERGAIDDDAMPESVQGIIAARIDLLTPEAKTLLQSAAVVGKVFWLGAIAEVAERERRAMEPDLHELERRELVRRDRRGSVEGEAEFAFRHILVRDVAYGQIPRVPRARMHQAAARWIESLGRPEDHAEMIAYHYATALDLSRAAGVDDPELAQSARLALRAAGERALALGAFAVAADLFERTVELWPATDPARPELMLSYGSTLQWLADPRAETVLSEARDGLATLGMASRAARAEALLSVLWWERGQRDRSYEHLDRSLALVADDPSSPDKLFVLQRAANALAIGSDVDGAIRYGEQALAMADELGLDDLRIEALAALGTARSRLGQPGGAASLEQAVELARSTNSPGTARLLNNLAFAVLHDGDVRRAIEHRADGVREARRFGVERALRWSRGTQVESDYYMGAWDHCVGHADAFIAECETGSPHYLESHVRQFRALVRIARDDLDGAELDTRRALELVRDVKDPQILYGVVSTAIRLDAELGRLGEARTRADEFLSTIVRAARFDVMMPFAWTAGRIDRAGALLERLPELVPATSLWLKAMREILEDRFEDAATTFETIGCVPDAAEARLRAGHALLASGEREKAAEQLGLALDSYRALGATRHARLGEVMFADTA